MIPKAAAGNASRWAALGAERKAIVKGKFGISGKDAKAFIRALKKCWFENPEKTRKREKYLRRYKRHAPNIA